MRIEGRWLPGADGIERPVLGGCLVVPGAIFLLTPPDTFTLHR